MENNESFEDTSESSIETLSTPPQLMRRPRSKKNKNIRSVRRKGIAKSPNPSTSGKKHKISDSEPELLSIVSIDETRKHTENKKVKSSETNDSEPEMISLNEMRKRAEDKVKKLKPIEINDSESECERDKYQFEEYYSEKEMNKTGESNGNSSSNTSDLEGKKEAEKNIE